VTRATVPIGEDIGFLPGTEEEKLFLQSLVNPNTSARVGGCSGRRSIDFSLPSLSSLA